MSEHHTHPSSDPLSFGFSEQDDWHHAASSTNTSPLGSYPNPTESSSPIGNSLLGSYPSPKDNTSPIGNSLLGSYPSPKDNTSPIGNSLLGSYPSPDTHTTPTHNRTVDGQDDRYTVSSAPAAVTHDVGQDENTVIAGILRHPHALLITWIAASVLLTLILSICGELWSIPFALSQLLFGVISYFNCERTLRVKLLKRFMLVVGGLYVLMIPLRLALPKYFAAASIKCGELIFVSLFLVMGLVVGLIPNFRTAQKKRHCTERISARCVQILKQHHHSHRHSSTTYCPVYEYYYNNERYESHGSTYSNAAVPKLGHYYDLLIDPSDPYTFYDIYRSGRLRIMFTLFGMFFVAFSLFGILSITIQYANNHL